MNDPEVCSCGQIRLIRFDGPGYVCLHCDRPCAGVAGPGRCDACDRMKVKR